MYQTQKPHEEPTPVMKPTTRWVRVGDLGVDPAYQRPLSREKVKKIVEHFDQDIFGILKVNQRPDGSMWVTDGQHRLAAAKELGLGFVEVQLSFKNEIAAEASQFDRINTQRGPVPALDRWRARRVAGDPVILAIETLLEEFHLSVTTHRGGQNVARMKAGTIAAPALLEDIYVRYGSQFLRSCLYHLTKTWPTDPEAVSLQLLSGVGRFLRAYQEHEGFSTTEFIRKLSTVSPLELRVRAGAFARAHGGHIGTAVAMEMLDVYNLKKHQENRLPAEALAGQNRRQDV